MTTSKYRCGCGGRRTHPCDTCGKRVCPKCRFSKHLQEAYRVLYTECKLCRYARSAWERRLSKDRGFMRWYGAGRKRSLTVEPSSTQAVNRKIRRDKERMGE